MLSSSPRIDTRFGLLPEAEGSAGSFATSAVVNGLLLLLVLYVGTVAHHAIQFHRYEQTQLILPDKEKEPEKPKVKVSEPPLPPPPVLTKVELEPPKIEAPVAPRPEPKPIQMETKLESPVLQQSKPQVVLAPQPRAALPTAAMPAQSASAKPSTAPVHFGQSFGVLPNANASRPATVAAIGNPYGGAHGAVGAPHGVVGSTGIGNGVRSGSNAGQVGRVASAGIPGATGTAAHSYGHVASAGIPSAQQASVARPVAQQLSATNLEILWKPASQYTSEARQARVQGDVVLRVTFLASGHVVVQGVVRGLGHGLDEEARRVAERIRFRPATRNGQPVDLTTTITIGFQLA